MALNLDEKDPEGKKIWVSKQKFIKEFKMSESTYHRRINNDMRKDSRFMNGYAAVTSKEIYINKTIYKEWLNAKAMENMPFIDF